MRTPRLAVVVLATALVACGPAPGPGAAGLPGAEPLVFAAASLRSALDELAEICRTSAGVGFRTSYAATSALARQLEAGAPADVFISADVDWMDYVAARGLIRDDSRIPLLGNRLVLVAPAAAPVALAIGPGFPLAAAVGDGRLAVADPEVVPAGKYAKAALESLGVWDDVAARIAPAENVRAALLLVSRAEAPLGIVYRSDARADVGVVVVDTFAEDTHPPIVYPAALTRSAGPGAADVLACLARPASLAVFVRWGFEAPTPSR